MTSQNLRKIRRIRENKNCLLKASLATKGGHGELGGPTPTLFSADIRNWYSLPSTKSVTENLSSVTEPLLIFSQRSVLARQRSTWYPVTGEPPSCFGGCQVTTHPVLLMSDTVSASGGPGLSARHNDSQSINHLLLQLLLP